MKIVTSEQMRQIDAESGRLGLPTGVLMENAGKAIAEETRRLLPDTCKNILVLTGPGNNGGDGLVAARYLYDWGAQVTVYLCSRRPAGDENLKLAQEKQIPCIDVLDDERLEKLSRALSAADAVIDSIFGTGISRPLHGIYPQVLGAVNQAKSRRPALTVIAVDVPSGMNADTGAVDASCLDADYTVTLALPKVGLYAMPGAEKAGKISVVDIGIPPHLSAAITTELIDAEMVRAILPARPMGANKGTFGKVLVAAGSINYIGAAYLACSGALRAGAGLVTLATPASLLPALAARLTEATYLPLPESGTGIVSADAYRTIHERMSQYDVMLAGCGLGQNPDTVEFVKSLLLKPGVKLPPPVLDADVLNVLAAIPEWWRQLPDEAILTPHPGEMARLTAQSIDAVQADRLSIARSAAARWHKTVVLKGAFTVIASPDGYAGINPFANPGMASGGTGDVLAGIIAGLAAQGLAPFNAATGGVYLHALAGERVKSRLGDAGMLASDLLPELPLAIKGLKEKAL